MFLQMLFAEEVPLNTPSAAAEDSDDARDYEPEDGDLAAVLYEGVAAVGRVGVQVRPGPRRAERSVNSKVCDDHHYSQRSGAQSGEDAEPNEECRNEFYPAGNVDQSTKPVWIRPGREVPEQEGFLRAVQSNQCCEYKPEEQVELVGVWLEVSPEDSRFLYVVSCPDGGLLILGFVSSDCYSSTAWHGMTGNY